MYDALDCIAVNARNSNARRRDNCMVDEFLFPNGVVTTRAERMHDTSPWGGSLNILN